MDRPILGKIIYEFCQDGNTDGTTAEYEELNIEVEGCFDIPSDGGYMVIRTKTGWSINNPEEFASLLALVNAGVPAKNTNNDEIEQTEK